MKDFDALTEQAMVAAEKDTLPLLEVEHVNRRLTMREKHSEELAEVYFHSFLFLKERLLCS